MRYGRRKHTILAALMLMLMAAAWLTMGPIQFGGQAAYVIVNGISMEPGMHRGDLAIMRASADYQVGDVVAYRHPQIGPVIHRIIAVDGDHLVFKGDNNAWTNSYRPTAAECIGKLWLFVPSAGGALSLLRAPRNMALLGAVLGVMVMTTVTGGQDRRPWRQPRRGPPLTIRLVFEGRAGRRGSRPAGEQTIGYLGASREPFFFALAALAFAALLLGAFAFTRPTVRAVSEELAYEQIGGFSYSATAPADLYNSGGVRTGDPVFRALTDAVDVEFTYRLAAEQASGVSGTYRLRAEVGDSSGWTRLVELLPETPFTGDSFSAAATLDLDRIQALIDSFEQQTALQRQQYVLAIVPEVSVRGTLAGQELHEAFAPRLEFRLDQLQLQVVNDAGSALDPLRPSQKGLLQHSVERPNTLALLGLTLEVAGARRLAVIGLLLALAGLAALGLVEHYTVRGDAAALIQLKYGALLIGILDGDLGAEGRVVDVAAIDDLAKLAEQSGHMILHGTRGTAHRYFVHQGDVVYRYQSASEDAWPAADGAP